MAATNFTPISLYYSTTASAVPTSGNLVAGELALNTLDEKLYFKNSAGTVKLLASNAASTGTVSSVAATVPSFLSITGSPITTSGTLAISLSGTALPTTSGGTGLTSFTSGGVVYASSSSALATGSALTYTGNILVNQPTVGTGFSLLQCVNTGGTAFIGLDNSSGGILSPYALNIYHSGAYPIIFSTSGTEGMRLTSTSLYTASGINVGIGTSSPATKLEVSGGSVFASGANRGINLGEQNCGILGDSATASAANMDFYTGNAQRMRITSAGNVGIGTSSPSSYGGRLVVLPATTATAYANSNQIQIGEASSNTGYRLNIGFYSDATYGWMGTIQAYAGGTYTNLALQGAGGNVGIGTLAPAAALHVVGSILATGNITAYYSDARLKTVSGKIENALDKVGKLSGVYYTNNSVAKSFGYDSDEVQVGVLAQDVEAVLPQIVKAAPFDLDQDGNSKSGENYKTVQYDKLVPLLIEAINELQAKVKALEAR